MYAYKIISKSSPTNTTVEIDQIVRRVHEVEKITQEVTPILSCCFLNLSSDSDSTIQSMDKNIVITFPFGSR